jgi:hypothetical protein
MSTTSVAALVAMKEHLDQANEPFRSDNSGSVCRPATHSAVFPELGSAEAFPPNWTIDSMCETTAYPISTEGVSHTLTPLLLECEPHGIRLTQYLESETGPAVMSDLAEEEEEEEEAAQNDAMSPESTKPTVGVFNPLVEMKATISALDSAGEQAYHQLLHSIEAGDYYSTAAINMDKAQCNAMHPDRSGFLGSPVARPSQHTEAEREREFKHLLHLSMTGFGSDDLFSRRAVRFFRLLDAAIVQMSGVKWLLDSFHHYFSYYEEMGGSTSHLQTDAQDTNDVTLLDLSNGGNEALRSTAYGIQRALLLDAIQTSVELTVAAFRTRATDAYRVALFNTMWEDWMHFLTPFVARDFAQFDSEGREHRFFAGDAECAEFDIDCNVHVVHTFGGIRPETFRRVLLFGGVTWETAAYAMIHAGYERRQAAFPQSQGVGLAKRVRSEWFNSSDSDQSVIHVLTNLHNDILQAGGSDVMEDVSDDDDSDTNDVSSSSSGSSSDDDDDDAHTDQVQSPAGGSTWKRARAVLLSMLDHPESYFFDMQIGVRVWNPTHFVNFLEVAFPWRTHFLASWEELLVCLPTMTALLFFEPRLIPYHMNRMHAVGFTSAAFTQHLPVEVPNHFLGGSDLLVLETGARLQHCHTQRAEWVAQRIQASRFNFLIKHNDLFAHAFLRFPLDEYRLALWCASPEVQRAIHTSIAPAPLKRHESHVRLAETMTKAFPFHVTFYTKSFPIDVRVFVHQYCASRRMGTGPTAATAETADKAFAFYLEHHADFARLMQDRETETCLRWLLCDGGYTDSLQVLVRIWRKHNRALSADKVQEFVWLWMSTAIDFMDVHRTSQLVATANAAPTNEMARMAALSRQVMHSFASSSAHAAGGGSMVRSQPPHHHHHPSGPTLYSGKAVAIPPLVYALLCALAAPPSSSGTAAAAAADDANVDNTVWEQNQLVLRMVTHLCRQWVTGSVPPLSIINQHSIEAQIICALQQHPPAKRADLARYYQTWSSVNRDLLIALAHQGWTDLVHFVLDISTLPSAGAAYDDDDDQTLAQFDWIPAVYKSLRLVRRNDVAERTRTPFSVLSRVSVYAPNIRAVSRDEWLLMLQEPCVPQTASWVLAQTDGLPTYQVAVDKLRQDVDGDAFQVETLKHREAAATRRHAVSPAIARLMQQNQRRFVAAWNDARSESKHLSWQFWLASQTNASGSLRAIRQSAWKSHPSTMYLRSGRFARACVMSLFTLTNARLMDADETVVAQRREMRHSPFYGLMRFYRYCLQIQAGYYPEYDAATRVERFQRLCAVELKHPLDDWRLQVAALLAARRQCVMLARDNQTLRFADEVRLVRNLVLQLCLQFASSEFAVPLETPCPSDEVFAMCDAMREKTRAAQTSKQGGDDPVVEALANLHVYDEEESDQVMATTTPPEAILPAVGNVDVTPASPASTFSSPVLVSPVTPVATPAEAVAAAPMVAKQILEYFVTQTPTARNKPMLNQTKPSEASTWEKFTNLLAPPKFGGSRRSSKATRAAAGLGHDAHHK